TGPIVKLQVERNDTVSVPLARLSCAYGSSESTFGEGLTDAIDQDCAGAAYTWHRRAVVAAGPWPGPWQLHDRSAAVALYRPHHHAGRRCRTALGEPLAHLKAAFPENIEDGRRGRAAAPWLFRRPLPPAWPISHA